MIEVQSLSLDFAAQRILDNVSVTIPRGGLVALVGANGAGKSTLLSVMSRLLAPTRGTVLLDGQDIGQGKSHQMAQKLAILRQDNHLTARLSVRDLVAFGRFPHSRGRLTTKDRAHIDDALAALGVADMAESFMDELSGGQRQRAFIAMVLCQDTDFILLDEPLNNLDMKHAVSMMETFRRLVDERGKTVIVVLHDINFASCYADRILALKDGAMIHDGPPETVITPAVIHDIYGIQTTVHTLGPDRIVSYYRRSG